MKLTGKVHGASDGTAILQRDAPQCLHTTRRRSHTLHHDRIGNTSGTMPIRHREPTANAARGKWRHNQRTLQWLDEQTIHMQLHSSRDSLLGKDIAVRRGQNTILTAKLPVERIHFARPVEAAVPPAVLTVPC
ncbi:regulator of sigma E protease [Trypanosoma cruzi]|nr:regulator of sigma E protease [Trypanosoma cruzi]